MGPMCSEVKAKALDTCEGQRSALQGPCDQEGENLATLGVVERKMAEERKKSYLLLLFFK
jgi:hypothetical protein